MTVHVKGKSEFLHTHTYRNAKCKINSNKHSIAVTDDCGGRLINTNDLTSLICYCTDILVTSLCYAHECFVL